MVRVCKQADVHDTDSWMAHGVGATLGLVTGARPRLPCNEVTAAKKKEREGI